MILRDKIPVSEILKFVDEEFEDISIEFITPRDVINNKNWSMNNKIQMLVFRFLNIESIESKEYNEIIGQLSELRKTKNGELNQRNFERHVIARFKLYILKNY
jgi:hypothetical protein